MGHVTVTTQGISEFSRYFVCSKGYFVNTPISHQFDAYYAHQNQNITNKLAFSGDDHAEFWTGAHHTALTE